MDSLAVRGLERLLDLVPTLFATRLLVVLEKKSSSVETLGRTSGTDRE